MLCKTLSRSTDHVNQTFFISDVIVINDGKFWRLYIILTDCYSRPCPGGGRCVKFISYWLEIPVSGVAAERVLSLQNKVKMAMRSCLEKKQQQHKTWWWSPLQRSRLTLLIMHKRAHGLNPYDPGGRFEFRPQQLSLVKFSFFFFFCQWFVHDLNVMV